MEWLKAMEWLNHYSGAVQAILTLALVLITLRYVLLTNRVAVASIEQSEALQKPCITLRTGPRDAEDAILDEPYVAQVAQTPRVELVNIGAGPAIKLKYSFTQTNVIEGGVALNDNGYLNQLCARDEWKAEIARGSLSNRDYDFLAEYEGLSGTRYTTTIRIESAVIRRFDFRRVEQS